MITSEVSREFVTSDARIMFPTPRLQGTSRWCPNGGICGWCVPCASAKCSSAVVVVRGSNVAWCEGWRRIEAASTHPVAHPRWLAAFCVPDFFAPLKGQRRDLPQEASRAIAPYSSLIALEVPMLASARPSMSPFPEHKLLRNVKPPHLLGLGKVRDTTDEHEFGRAAVVIVTLEREAEGQEKRRCS